MHRRCVLYAFYVSMCVCMFEFSLVLAARRFRIGGCTASSLECSVVHCITIHVLLRYFRLCVTIRVTT